MEKVDWSIQGQGHCEGSATFVVVDKKQKQNQQQQQKTTTKNCPIYKDWII